MMHSGVSHVIYTDFGQNCGRYVVGNTNALLQHIREQDGGIKITYTDGHDDYVLPLEQGMIDFSMGYYQSTAAAISPTLIATVGHNGEIDSNFTARVQGIGSGNTLNYAAIGIQGSSVFSNYVNNGQYHDWRVTRLSKVATDVSPAPMCTDAAEAAELVSGNNMFYHAGGGLQKRPTGDWPYQAYVFVTGGIIDPTNSWTTTGDGVLAQTNYNSGYNGINATNPLPYVALGGDSGSPVYVYDSEAGAYKFWGCTVLSSGTTLATYISFTHRYQQVSAMFNKDVDMSGVSQVDGANVLYMNAVSTAAGEKTDGTNSTTLYTANITDAEDNVVATHVGLQTGLSTWSSLNALRDTQNWYNYGNNYVAQKDADLFYTENLLFKSSAEKNTVVLRDTVDLGVGYAEFSAAGEIPVSYTITSESGESNMLNSAGYIVDENVAVHLQLTSSDSHLYEWRKIGAGDLYIEGSGNNDVLLNIGGSGKTYLNRENGYAAYNVLVNNGATLVIKDAEQIARDLTFGHKGGTLDLNDNDMDWRTTAETQASPLEGFSINALTEDATIANYSGVSTITYTQSGDTTYLGSFADSANSSLKVVYDVADGTWTLNSIRTKLQNAASGLEVKQGKVVLSGTNTVHGASSNMPESHTRYTHEDDWHYADAAMNVVVKDDATFELGSHARLTGDVTVESGGTYVMREGVRHAQEYVEGSMVLEDTAKYAAFYGHKGNTSLAEGASMQIAFSDATTATNTYNGNITGAGSISVNAAKGILLLGGTSTLTGKKTLTQGGLVATTAGALGETTTNKWVVGQDGWIASHAEDGNALLGRVDETSTGTLALSSDTSTQLTMSAHKGLYLGAEEGKTVQYGELGTSATLNAVEGAWRLGGGGGTLVVNYVLSGDNSLLLGSSENARGTVHLTNTQNSFTGSIVFNSTGVILTYEDGALGKASVSLDYSNSMELLKAQDILQLSGGSDGMVLVDAVADSALTLSNHANLALGASTDTTMTGTITVAENQAYRFGTQNGATLRVESALAAGHDVVVDAQGSTGGKVVLAGAETLSGKLTVQGNKTSDATGHITLELAGDMALEGAAAVQNGGAIDVAGHTLTSKGELNGNGTLTDSSSEKSGSLVLDMGAADKTIHLNLQLGNIEKHGSGTLNLTGNNNFGTLTVKAGTVSIDDSASSAGNLVVLEAGTTMSSNGNVLADISMGDGSVITNNGNRLKGQISVQNGATTYYNSLAGYTAVDNSILLGEDSTLYLGRENGVSNELDLKGNQYGQAASGRMVLRNINKVNIVNRNNVHFAGTFEVDANTLLKNDASAESKLREFDHLQVNAGKTLSLTEVSWNTIWNIHELTGDGDIRWTSTATHSTPSVMRLDGEGSFSGDITVLRTNDYAARRFQAFVELQHDKAAQNATLVLAGDHANAGVALAVNTDNAHIAGLQNYAGTDASTTNAYVIAGPPPANTSGNDPVSGRSATLTFTGSGECTFSGKIGHAADTAEQSLSLVMNGSGRQTLDGSSVIVNNVSALKGSLNIAPASLTVLGDVSIAEGAALKLGESYTLSSGQTLSVLDSAANSSALFNSNLILDGGDIYFGFLSSDYAALDINGAVSLASGTNGLNINFADNDALQMGVTYQLAAGDWSQLAGKISMFTPEMYKNVTLTANSDGLSLLLSMKEGFSYWQGTNSEFGEGKSLVFLGGEGALGHVEITGGAVADAAVFDNTSDFTISATDGSTLAFDAMEKNKSGALIVNTKVMANSLNVVDDFALGGTGTLAVGDMTGSGTLQVQSGAHLQVESAEGAVLHLLDGATLTTTGTQIASDVTLGQEKTSSLVTLDIQGATLSLSGEVSSLGSTTLAVQGTGALNYHAGLNDLAELRLSQNTALNVATTLSTKVQQNGATVNVNNGGTWQLEDDHGAFDGAVVVNAGGRLEGGDLVTEKSFSLGGSMSYDSFTVQNGGTLNLQSGGRLDATNAATISGSGVMNLNGNTLADKVHLKNGGTMYGGGGTIATEASVLAAEGTGKLNAGGRTFNVNGQIGASKDAILRLENGTFNIYAKSINDAGGTLELACSTVRMGYKMNAATQNIGGTLSIANNLTLIAQQGDPTKYQGMTFNINHLHIDDCQLTLEVPTSEFWHVYNIASLTGAGTLLWMNNMGWHQQGTARMVLTGDNDYSGELIVQQKNNAGSIQHVSLAHENAAKNMVINLWGDTDSRPGLAISTDTARVAGIGGTVNTFVYAGAVKTAANGDNPTSSALNTLIINTGTANHTYYGTLLGDSSYGLNIVKDGSGTQTFDSGDSVVHDVIAKQGSLVFTNAPTIYGDMGVAQGATLQIGTGELSLDAGETLRVLKGTDGSVATLNNSLVLNGGTLDFGVYNEEQASLVLGEGFSLSLGSADTVKIAFSNRGNIKEQVNFPNLAPYLLMGGDWSSVADKITVEDCRYLDVNLTAGTDGLKASFTMKEGHEYWMGEEVEGWKPTKENVVITGMAPFSDTINLKENTTIRNGFLDNNTTVVINSDNANTLHFNALEKMADGGLVLNTGVSAGTFMVNDDTRLSGSGTLTVDALNLAQKTLLEITELTMTVNNSLSTQGKISIAQGGALKMGEAMTGAVHLKNGGTLHTTGSAVAANLTLGEIGADSRVTIKFDGSGLNLGGAVTTQGNATLAVQGTGTLNFSNLFNNLAALELGRGVDMQPGSTLTTHLVLDGGTAKAQGSGLLQGAITVKNGGTFTFAGGVDVCDTLKHAGNFGRTITVTGSNSTLAFGNTRQTMANWNLVLSDGAVVSGSGGEYAFGGTSRRASLDFNLNNSTVSATSGNSTISAITRLRGGNNLNYDVSEGATLTVSGLIQSDNVANAGSITKNGAGTLVLSCANTYANTTTVNGGILSASVEGALGTSNLVINDGGTALIGGNNNKLVASNVTVNRGGLLSFVGSGSDMLDYDQQNKSITVDGGTLDFGNTRQTMGSWGITLKNGGSITGTGGNYDASIYAAAMDFSNNARIIVESGENNTIESNIRLRNANSRTLSFDVAEGAGLIVSGRIHADTNAARGNLVKEGAGSMNISSQVMLDTLTNKSGELKLTHTEAQNVVRLLDSSNGNTCNGSLRLAENVDLKVTGEIWTCANSEYVLDKGASLTSTQDGVIISNRSGAAETRISIAAAEGEYSVANSNYELSNAYVQYDSSQAGDLKNKLTHSTVANVNRGGETLTVSHADNTLSGLRAETGAINVLNQENLSLEELYIAASLEVSVVTTGEGVAFNAANEASVAVVGMAEFGDGATLKANLKMTAGSELKLGGTVHMGSSLELVSNGLEAVTLSGGMLIQVQSMKAGDTLTVFTGVDELILTHNGSSTYYAPGTLTIGSGVLASTYFENLRDTSVADTLFMTFTNDVNGAGGDLVFAMVPEPATTTLSILALSALAARRRRK